MASCTLYLEQYVESTTTLPSELQRVLATIRFLDEKTCGLRDAIAAQTEALVAMPPPGQRGPEQEAAFRELNGQVTLMQSQLLQFAEEKVQLGQQANDLLQMHYDELEKTMEQFESEFVGPAMHLAPSHDYHPFEFGGPPPKGASRASAGGRGGFDQWDSLEPLQAPPIKRSSGQKSNKRARDDGRGGGNATAAVLEAEAGGYSLPPAPSVGMAAAMSGGDLGGAGAPPSGGGGGGGGPPAAAAYSGGGVLPPSGGPGGGGGGGGMGGPHGGGHHGHGGGGGPHGPGGGGGGGPGGDAPLVFTNTAATANLLDAAPHPQLPGRLLRMEDITTELIGKLAEMFWPDDNMWYLIEIQRVNAGDKTATIVYKTGEIEDLNLQEIAQEGHMSLIEDRVP
ncbi:MAG: hypothetical protein J3K34DRAFT_515351 [Monoraphidium minutum]|nr:MAG: hypothetical protein J3K34DRAFT_515351 [Monoraphidium minutum]